MENIMGVVTRIFIRLSFVLILLGDACVEPLDVDLTSIKPRLVVDGELTNTNGPYQVRLLYTTRLDSTLRYPAFEVNANVTIVDEQNNVEQLYEVKPGIYQTSELSSFIGQVGKSYYLRIVTQSGDDIRSGIQKMLPVPEINSVGFEFVQDALDLDPNETSKDDAFRIFIEPSSLIGSADHVRWRWSGTFYAKTFPELAFNINLRGQILQAPPECSGIKQVGNSLVTVGPCTCCYCWGTDYSADVHLSDDSPGNTQSTSFIDIGLVPITSLHFYEKYYVEVEQMSLNSDVYEFWKLVRAQQKSGGNIFQPNSVKVRGNMKSITHPDEEILGVFSVSAIERKTIFIYPDDIPGLVPPMDTLKFDCRVGLPNGTLDRPEFW